MKRDDILSQFEVEERGTDWYIVTPGKFEGEVIYAPFLHDLMSEGCTEVVYDGDKCVDYVEVDDDMREEFPEIASDSDILSLVETCDGFVECREWTKIEWDNYVDSLLDDEDFDEDDESWD